MSYKVVMMYSLYVRVSRGNGQIVGKYKCRIEVINVIIYAAHTSPFGILCQMEGLSEAAPPNM